MNCPYCTSTATKQQIKKTSLDCRTSRCESRANAPSTNVQGTLCHFLEDPTDIVLLVVLWRLRYTLSLRDLAEQRRLKRRGHAGESWDVDGTHFNVHWELMLSLEPSIAMATGLIRGSSKKRDIEAAKRFFQQAVAMVGHTAERLTTDGHAFYPRALCETLGNDVIHRCHAYLNNRLEQDHRGIKQRSSPIGGFGGVVSAARLSCACDERRQFLRVRLILKCRVSLVQQRDLLRHRLEALKALVLVA
jgi:transposase-like protein